MTEERKLEARITFNGMTEEFTGDFDKVSRAIIQFLFEICPDLSLLSKIRFAVDEKKLVEEIADVIKFDEQGPLFLADVSDFSASDLIIMHLSVAHIGYRIGFLEIDRLTIDEICELTGVKKNVVIVRLSGLAKKKFVHIPETGKRGITSRGLAFFADYLLPRLKETTSTSVT